MRTDNITMPEKLTFTDFMKAFRAQYMYGTPDLKNFLITEQQIHKNNKNLHGIIIRSPGKRIAPVFYYEDFYDAYKKGTTIDECIRKMYEFVSGTPLPDERLGEIFSNWANVKDKLVVKLINFKKNRDQLATVPHRIFGDMGVVVQIYLDDPSIGRGAVMVDSTLLSIWQIERTELFDVAMKNMEKLRIRSLNLLDFDMDEKIRDPEAPNIYVVSYDSPIPGASVMLQTEHLTEFAIKHGSDFYILPVSVHEVLLIEKKKGVGEEMLTGMLRAINQDTSISENMLSEEVYLLDRNEGKVQYLAGGKELLMSAP